jgi:hypothetical protein
MTVRNAGPSARTDRPVLHPARPAPSTSSLNQADPACQERGSGDLAQALFDYNSAGSHADLYLRDIVWRREEEAILALGTTASLAQFILARP